MSAELLLRPASPDDVDAVVALVESAYRGAGSRAGWTTEADLLDGQRTDREAVLGAVTGERTVVLLAEAAGRLLGCAQVAPVDERRWYFGMFAVSPGEQGGGVGSLLLSAAEEHAREHGGSVLEMTVIGQRGELIAWYERRGYRRTGQTRPFPYGDERFGRPRRDDLYFVVLERSIDG